MPKTAAGKRNFKIDMVIPYNISTFAQFTIQGLQDWLGTPLLKTLPFSLFTKHKEA